MFYFFEDLSGVFLLIFDEVVEKKSGKSTSLVGRFFSSIVGKSIRSVCYHVCSVKSGQVEAEVQIQ